MPAEHPVRSALRELLFAILLASVAWAVPPGEAKPAAPTLHWGEDQPGCTFSRDDDGKYRYGLWTADFGIVVGVDSQELEKSRRRSQPILALHLTIHGRSKDSIEVAPGKITLEFVKHYHDIHRSLNPDDLASQQRSDIDSLVEQTEHDIQKHAEKTKDKEAMLAARRKDATEMIEFLDTRSLRAAKLDSNHLEVNGWVFFNTKSKWIDELRKQEEFVLRIPLDGRIVEFPFALPPSEGDLILRRRPEN